MLKTTSALLFSAALFSTTAHAVIQDQQWGNWFGNRANGFLMAISRGVFRA